MPMLSFTLDSDLLTPINMLAPRAKAHLKERHIADCYGLDSACTIAAAVGDNPRSGLLY